jgi:hypothetical protein
MRLVSGPLLANFGPGLDRLRIYGESVEGKILVEERKIPLKNLKDATRKS